MLVTFDSERRTEMNELTLFLGEAICQMDGLLQVGGEGALPGGQFLPRRGQGDPRLLAHAEARRRPPCPQPQRGAHQP